MEEKIKNLKFELKNIRQNQKALKVVFKKDFEALRKSLGGGSVVEESVNKRGRIFLNLYKIYQLTLKPQPLKQNPGSIKLTNT